MRRDKTFQICGALLVALLLSCGCQRTRRERDEFLILTPPAPAIPRINGPRVFGVRPGAPFLFQIPATGERPMRFAAGNLPAGLTIDAEAGLITGRLEHRGRFEVELEARNRLGRAARTLAIVVGEEIALTPPMGWSSWNCWGGKVSQEKVESAARAIVRDRLREHGWSYLNIDDGWQGVRGGPFNAIQPNKKFPDLAGLADEVHAAGLKLGIYSTPWRTSYYAHIGSTADHADGTCDWIRAGQHTDVFRYRFPRERLRLSHYAWLQPMGRWLEKRRLKKINDQLRTFGKFSFVQNDARQWGAWGVDFLKYDWDPTDLAHIEEMQQALRATGRDIVYTLANDVDLSLAPRLIGRANAWRGTIDIHDKWRDLAVGFHLEKWAPFSGPGHYTDPDMLVIGRVGWDRPRLTMLTSDEQYTQVSLWCLLAAPLILGCDLEQLNPFTLGLITNDEVLAVDQDALCKQATRVAGAGDQVVYGKPLEDGSWALGLFNRGRKPARLAVKWRDLGRNGKQKVRDLWRQKDLGVFTDGFVAEVAPHGVVMIRLTTAAGAEPHR